MPRRKPRLVVKHHVIFSDEKLDDSSNGLVDLYVQKRGPENPFRRGMTPI